MSLQILVCWSFCIYEVGKNQQNVFEDLFRSNQAEHLEYMNLKMNFPLKADHLDWEQIRRTVGADLEGIGSRLDEHKGCKENEVVQIIC